MQNDDRPRAGQFQTTAGEPNEQGIDVPAHVHQEPGDGPHLREALRDPQGEGLFLEGIGIGNPEGVHRHGRPLSPARPTQHPGNHEPVLEFEG